MQDKSFTLIQGSNAGQEQSKARGRHSHLQQPGQRGDQVDVHSRNDLMALAPDQSQSSVHILLKEATEEEQVSICQLDSLVRSGQHAGQLSKPAPAQQKAFCNHAGLTYMIGNVG